MNFNITVTLSKVLAYLMLGLSVLIDFKITHTASTFMYTVPFSVALIMGKQGSDILLKKIK